MLPANSHRVSLLQYTNIIWRNEQPYSELFDDIYHSSDSNEPVSGESEFKHVFFNHNGLPERWQDSNDFVIAELGFGSGLNCMLTIREWLKHCAQCDEHKTLHYIAIEKHPLSPETIQQLTSNCPDLISISEQLLAFYPPAIKANHCRRLFNNRVVVHFMFMDVLEALNHNQLNVDAWFLDGFSPAKNPDMWSQQVFLKIKQNSNKGSSCSTYTCAGFVKRHLKNAGFVVKKVAGYGRKREMLCAHLPNSTQTDVATSFKYKHKPWFSRPLPSTSGAKNLTIIGAGIAGLSLAYAMIQRGYRVTIIDAQTAKYAQASTIPAPIVYPRLSLDNDVDTEFFVQAYCYARYIFQLLQKKSAQRFYFDDGLFQLMDKQRITKIKEKFKFNDDFLSIMDNTIERAGTSANVYYATAGVVLPDILCDSIKSACAEHLTIINTTVSEVKHDGKRWQCLHEASLVNKSEILVIANSTGINNIGLPLHFPVESVRGQLVCLNENEDSYFIKKTQNASVHITPAINGKHYLGATYARNNSSLEIDDSENTSLLQSLDMIYPGVFTEADICHTWVGFRAVSKDRVPIVGAIPDALFFQQAYADLHHGSSKKNYLPASHLDGLFISAAHGSRGFTSCFLCAEIIATQITGEPSPVNKKILDHLNPSRFIVNDFKRR